MFPIKYMENNLIWNNDGEVYAYYELLPYNYSFLSAEQKIMIHDSFTQLVAQSREGNIHFLCIATENSLTLSQEKAKQMISGNLKDKAVEKLEEQTQALVEMIGDKQLEYRYYIGFRLMVNKETVSVENVKEMLKNTLKLFLSEVSRNVMGDFVSIPFDEAERYKKLERLLEHRISRRFKFRKIDKNDLGYILDHIYCNEKKVYEEYEYILPKMETEKETVIKRYDILRPTQTLIEENRDYLTITKEDKVTYVAYLPMHMLVDELTFPSCELFYYQQSQFLFPVDVSVKVEVMENRKALGTVRNKKKELKDLDNHAYNSGNETGNSIETALDSVDELEEYLERSKDSIYKMSYAVRITADNLEELKRRIDTVKDFYDDLNIKLIRPCGDMMGYHKEFIPTSKRYISDYVQYVKADFFASLGFGATQQLGEKNGIYIGYSKSTGANIFIQPWLASQGVKGSVTNTSATAFIGSLGGGKSFSNNLNVYYSALFGAKAVVLDPKSERGRWKETLSDIAHEISIVNLTSEKKNRGMLDPFVIMKNRKDAESLAIDILTFLTGISLRDGDKYPVLSKAVASVAEMENGGLLHVIEELRKQENQIAYNLADHIESFISYDFAHLMFSDGRTHNGVSLDRQINIIQVADLMLPDKDKKFEEYTAMELLSVAVMIAISTFCLDFIQSDRSTYKIVDLDEAWAFLNVAQGQALANKLIRAGRSMNSGVYFVTQSAFDVSKETIKNNIGMKFAFRSTDIKEIKETLDFYGLDKEDEGNQKILRELENGDCLFQDIYGHVGVIHIHPVFEELFRAFDTRPPVKKEETDSGV